jgi:hypothetical protein
MPDSIEVKCPVCDTPIAIEIEFTEADDSLSPREAFRLTGFRNRSTRTAHLAESAPQRCDHAEPADSLEADSLTFTQREREQLARQIKRELRAINRGEYNV